MTTAAARLILRLSPSDKALVVHAARLRGIPVAVFVRTVALREAERVIATRQSVADGLPARHGEPDICNNACYICGHPRVQSLHVDLQRPLRSQ